MVMSAVKKLDFGVAREPIQETAKTPTPAKTHQPLSAVQKMDGLTLKGSFDAKERRALAKEGKAMPDGSYPITNGSDLRHAIELCGMGSDGKEAIKQHIITRAKALGLEKELPDSWTTEKAQSPNNPLQSNPENTDTMQEDPSVDGLKTPLPASALLRRPAGAKLRRPGTLPMQATPMDMTAISNSLAKAN